MTDADVTGDLDPEVAAFAAKWPPIEVDDETRAWTTARAAELLAERDARSDDHRRRIEQVARRAGGWVARGEVTIQAAARTIGNVVHAVDENHPVKVRLVPFAEAEAIADRAFAAGVRSARQVA